MADFVIGEIEEITNTDNEKEIQWKIPNFLSLSDDCYYLCPVFKFLNVHWYLNMDPSEFGTADHIALLLKTSPIYSSFDVMCTFGIKNADGSMTAISSFKHTLHPQEYNMNITLTVHKFFTMRELVCRDSELVPLGNLTIICNLKLLSSPVSLSGNMKFISSIYNVVYKHFL